LAATWREK